MLSQLDQHHYHRRLHLYGKTDGALSRLTAKVVLPEGQTRAQQSKKPPALRLIGVLALVDTIARLLLLL
jgi:hypothetical protein